MYSVTGKGPAMSIAILWKGEPMLYSWSFAHRTGRTFLAPVLDVLSTTDQVKSLPNFRKRPVKRQKWVPALLLCISWSIFLFLMAGTTNCMVVCFPSGLSQARLSNPFSTRRESHWAHNALKEGDSCDISAQPGRSTPSCFYLRSGPISTSPSATVVLP